MFTLPLFASGFYIPETGTLAVIDRKKKPLLFNTNNLKLFLESLKVPRDKVNLGHNNKFLK